MTLGCICNLHNSQVATPFLVEGLVDNSFCYISVQLPLLSLEKEHLSNAIISTTHRVADLILLHSSTVTIAFF